MHFRMIACLAVGALLLVGCAAQDTATTTTGTSRPTSAPGTTAKAKADTAPNAKLCSQVATVVAGIATAKKAVGSTDAAANAKVLKALSDAATSLAKAAPKLKADLTVVVAGLAAQLGVPAPGSTEAKAPGTTVAEADWTKARDNINRFRVANCQPK